MPATRRPGTPYARVIVEKPFGVDLASAKQPIVTSGGSWTSARCFASITTLVRDDAEPAGAALRATRFEPLWNRSHVSHVELTADYWHGRPEQSSRADGLMCDIVQNTTLQLLSLVAMECPSPGTPTPYATRR
ncbi:MAG: hypothetical protein IPI67_00105 [Myxococcales bacterium]|nr:hypothetical protein [Myxococcales bacterium]